MMLKEDSTFKISSSWFSKRYFIAAMLFLGYFNMFAVQSNISIAIVEMTSNKTVIVNNETIFHPPEFNWDSKRKGIALSMYSYGSLFSIIAGYFVKKLGGATSIGTGIIIPAILNVLAPFTIRINFYLFLISRFFEGIFESLAYAGTSEIWSKWAPVGERSRLMAINFTGVYVGMIIVFPLCGFLAHRFGWESTFFTTGMYHFMKLGGISLIWAVLWLIFVSNEPSTDKWISKKELMYLQAELGPTINNTNKIDYPWKSIFTSKAIWALLLSKFTYGCARSIVVTCLPLFMKDMTKTDVEKVGLLSAIPNIGGLLAIPVGGFIADYLQNKGVYNSAKIHKMFVCIGFILGACLLFFTAYSTSFVTSIICLIFFKVLLALCFLSLQSIILYMAPCFSGLIAALTCYGYGPGVIFCPMFVGFIVTSHTHLEWSICFVTIGIIMIIGSVIFLLFGSSEAQPWASLQNEEESDNFPSKPAHTESDKFQVRTSN